ncbi:MAG: hypothetical protein J3Q66DRAFT_339966 [Benniella sp.]|nr:MAG: hypothetical protein J3Q66DRAFT_339966 [Benniella sp.]
MDIGQGSPPQLGLKLRLTLLAFSIGEAKNSLLYLVHSRSGYGWTLCQTSGRRRERVSQGRSISGLFCNVRRDEGQRSQSIVIISEPCYAWQARIQFLEYSEVFSTCIPYLVGLENRGPRSRLARYGSSDNTQSSTAKDNTQTGSTSATEFIRRQLLPSAAS